jgi:hypothetical protein
MRIQMTRFSKLRLLAAVALSGALLTAGGYAEHLVMTQTVTSVANASLSSTQASTVVQGSASYTPTLRFTLSMLDGTTDNKIKIIKADSGSIAASDSLLIDLAGTALDAFGQVITCTTMKGIMVTADSSNVNDVLVGGARVAQVNFLANGLGGAADTNHLVPVGPGGVFMWIRPKTGATVTATTNDIIRFKNSGGTSAVKYKSQILCR